MTTIVAKNNVYENCNVNKNIIVNEKSSEIKDAVVINCCSNCNNNIIELPCCCSNEKIPCNLKETVFEISIKQKELLLAVIIRYWSQLFILILSFLLCHFLYGPVLLREIQEVPANFLNGTFDIEAAKLFRDSNSKNYKKFNKQLETNFRYLFEIFGNTSDIELADLHSSILQNFSFMNVDSMLNFYIYLFAKGNPGFFINLKFFIQVGDSKDIFSMIFLLLAKPVISSFFTQNFLKLFRNKFMICLSTFFTLTTYFTYEVLRSDQGTGQIQQDGIRWAERLSLKAERLRFPPIENVGLDILFYLIIMSLHYLNECRLSKMSFFSLKRANKKCLISAFFDSFLIFAFLLQKRTTKVLFI